MLKLIRKVLIRRLQEIYQDILSDGVSKVTVAEFLHYYILDGISHRIEEPLALSASG